jgi:hypothetical protein
MNILSYLKKKKVIAAVLALILAVGGFALPTETQNMIVESVCQLVSCDEPAND